MRKQSEIVGDFRFPRQAIPDKDMSTKNERLRYPSRWGDDWDEDEDDAPALVAQIKWETLRRLSNTISIILKVVGESTADHEKAE